MSVRLAAMFLMLSAGFGCRACSNCYDYSSPVANSQYAHLPGRAGSAFHGASAVVPSTAVSETPAIPVDLTIPDAPQFAAEPINPTATPALFVK